MNTSTKAPDQLQLAVALTQKTRQICIGLEGGDADILEVVTPITAELLRWWFGDDACASRKFNFHPGQKQAILNTIIAHEVLNTVSLKDLYQQVCADALFVDDCLAEVSQSKHDYPKYCLKMATGTGKTWVLQALLIWQFMNKTAALEAGIDDLRFTRQFLVVAPGLIVYERLLDAFCGKVKSGTRDFATSDIAAFANLFIPESMRERVFAFVRGNVCQKAEIGLKATGNGMIAITNWHLLAEAEEELPEEGESFSVPGAIDPVAVVSSLLPLVPGRSAGNSLDQLDRRYARGKVLGFLSDLPDLLVFNDEAHHIHEFKRAGEMSEVEWQNSLLRIAATKGRRFAQVDFSATPYNDLGSGKKKSKKYFPHIIVDFDLPTAMGLGLVKSLVLDRRKEIGALPLEFKADRDDDGKPVLSEGQRLMLRAGLQKLYKLEADFAPVDANRHPKMLVVCEDTSVSPEVVKFLREEGLTDEEVMAIDSGKKAELAPKEWDVVRERLFDVDRHRSPRVIVSVLMLREGFDVSNICVIVPLRSSEAQILLEQIIGRGLRLMWREPEYADIKRENRQSINDGKEPGSLIDILSIIEHPAFSHYYDDLMRAGVAGSITEFSDTSSGAGDMIAVELRADFEQYDFALPFILREAEEWVEHGAIDTAVLPPFSAMSLEELQGMLGKGDTFSSLDLQSSTLFGTYRVHGAIMSVSGYNDWLARITRRIGQALAQPLPRGNRISDHIDNPYMQTNTVVLAAAVDEYVAEKLFGPGFEPLIEENWRLLLLRPVVDHMVKIFAHALTESREDSISGEVEVRYRRLSEVSRLMMRASNSMDVGKCIYPKLPYPAQSGGLEKAFMAWAQSDADVYAFCKISETRHEFARLRYIKDDGLAAFYSPDFLVRTVDAIYVVETKAQQQVSHPNVQRKLKAAVAWCERLNALPANLRSDLPWHYVLLGESAFYDWRQKGARLAELLSFARVRPQASLAAQAQLEGL
jgi:type III restriction enzyme